MALQPYDETTAADFYEKRFAHGYTEYWPPEKKRRLRELIRGIELPAAGRAIDFGCGNGIMTEVIREALPGGWTSFGTDISQTAISNAGALHPRCKFLLTKDAAEDSARFDLLMTHHVLEHAADLGRLLDAIDRLVNAGGLVLHILPCGNEGSFEHRICSLRRDGIDPTRESRFFFEDEGHVRRLTSEQLAGHYRSRGYSLVREWYGGQHHGALEWITRSAPNFVLRLTDPSHAVDSRAAAQLRRLRRKLFSLWSLRFAAPFVERTLGKQHHSWAELAALVPGLLLYPLMKPMDLWMRRQSEREWRERNGDRAGSEMYLLFRRTAT